MAEGDEKITGAQKINARCTEPVKLKQVDMIQSKLMGKKKAVDEAVRVLLEDRLELREALGRTTGVDQAGPEVGADVHELAVREVGRQRQRRREQQDGKHRNQ